MALGADPIIWTPAAVLAKIEEARAFIEGLNRDFEKPAVPGDLRAAWRNFYDAFVKFYGTGPSTSGYGGPSTLWGGNAVTAQNYEDQAVEWRKRLVDAGVVPSVPEKPTAPDLTDKILPLVKWGLAIIVAAVVLPPLFRTGAAYKRGGAAAALDEAAGSIERGRAAAGRGAAAAGRGVAWAARKAASGGLAGTHRRRDRRGRFV